MTESLEATADITLIRRELGRLRDDVKRLGKQVEQVDAKVERARVTELGALAMTLQREDGVDPALILLSAGMSREDVCDALNLSPAALRQRISRARGRRRKAMTKAGGQ